MKHHLPTFPPLPWGIPASSPARGYSQRQNKAAARILGKTNIRNWNLNRLPVSSEGFGLDFNHFSLKFGVNRVGAEPVGASPALRGPCPRVKVHWNSCRLREKRGICSEVKRSQLEWVSHPPLPTASATLGDFIKPGKKQLTLEPNHPWGARNLDLKICGQGARLAGLKSVWIPLGIYLGALRCREGLNSGGFRPKLTFFRAKCKVLGDPPSSAHLQLLCPGPHPFSWKWPNAGRGCIVRCLPEKNQPKNKKRGNVVKLWLEGYNSCFISV